MRAVRAAMSDLYELPDLLQWVVLTEWQLPLKIQMCSTRVNRRTPHQSSLLSPKTGKIRKIKNNNFIFLF
jgi:hypothetical protein